MVAQPDLEVFEAKRQTAEALRQVLEDAELEAGVPEPERAVTDDGVHPRPPLLHADASSALDIGTLLLAFAVLGAVLAVALVLAGDSSAVSTARVVVVVVACAALVAEYVMGEREATELHPLALLSAPVAAAVAAALARLLDHELTSGALTLAAAVIGFTAIGVVLVRRERAPLDAERDRLRGALEQSGHRVAGEGVASARPADLRPGEEVVVEAGETVPADVTIVAGSIVVEPWLFSRSAAKRAEGEAVVAGARVLDGRARAVVGWAGPDRAWVRLTLDPRRRADVHAPSARFGRLAAERIAPLGAGLAALTVYAANGDLLAVLLSAVAAQAALANSAVAELGALSITRAVLTALRRGVAFRTAQAVENAGRVSSAAFCARGTVLLGEPEVANIDATSSVDANEVLALIAGAEAGATHPVATAVLRAARARGVRPDAVRSPNVQPGLGVTATASTGEQLVVGSRGLMLKERISVAAAERKISDLEAMGRTVLLAALAGRLIGVVGLQDGLRPGARAAVQHLLDVGVEPVLLSGDTRETCEAIGRALDIEHIRPELLPTERGDEVRRMADGATVAVIGRSPVDDASLAAADVSIALSAAGSSAAEWNVQLASDDVRDAAFAVRLAHECRLASRITIALTLGSGVLGALGVAFSLIPLWAAPFASLLGLFLALLKLRSDRHVNA